ncbi:MAG TPA: glycosyltransferase family 87 protein [Candidatus Binatia bacterium]|nr:glycosyltransferase family 87 protein [Candidatus Binatia bacterium]
MTRYRALVFLATVFALASGIFLLDNNLFSQRERFQESDFIMTFYVAGHLAASGRSDELYPQPDARSFIDSPFDKAAHALLPHLPKATTGAYMYIPLVAGFFAPFSFIDPNLSLFLWQALSVLALGLSCLLWSRLTAWKTSDAFFLSFLYTPVFLTLWAGQLGLGLGLLPLCAGYVLLLRQRPLAAGIVWSVLLLKPQYFFPAAFVALACAVRRRYRALVGIMLGLTVLIALTILAFSPSVTLQWLLSHKVSDAYFFEGLQGIPNHLLTGLPANLMVLFPVNERRAVKFPLYAGAAALWLFGLWFCTRAKWSQLEGSARVSLTFVIGLILSSLTLPHLLYYDLCVLLPAGFLLLAKNGPLPSQKGLRTIAVLGWITVSGFLPLLLSFTKQKLLPLILELILLILFMLLLRHVNKFQNAAGHT